MARHEFLSDEWIEAAQSIAESDGAQGSDAITPLQMNLVVVGAPFEPEPLEAHLDTSAGRFLIGRGHLGKADVTVRLPYDIAKAVLIDGNSQMALSAFFTRKLRVDGDMSKLLAFGGRSTTRQNELTEQLRSITA